MKRLFLIQLRRDTDARCSASGCTNRAVFEMRRAHWMRQGYGHLRCSECVAAVARTEGREEVRRCI